MKTRTVKGTIRGPTTAAIAGKKIRFGFHPGGFSFDVVAPNTDPIETTTDDDGAFSIDLWTNGDEGIELEPSYYEARLPGGDRFWFSLPDGTPAIDINLLKAMASINIGDLVYNALIKQLTADLRTIAIGVFADLLKQLGIQVDTGAGLDKIKPQAKHDTHTTYPVHDPSRLWSIPHDFTDRRPFVSITDDAGQHVNGQITYLPRKVEIRFNKAIAGTAELS